MTLYDKLVATVVLVGVTLFLYGLFLDQVEQEGAGAGPGLLGLFLLSSATFAFFAGLIWGLT